ncbi:hypothetical protein AAX26_01819 [Aliarcobacter thereius]|uniref:hypothetical protein n=1 Tax=Aliarcobacter thereius TaxID=544718 RepID=UPI000827641D|nr:hypothetical protein [Aliarcobacter thereius]OCL84007.1 hypothetical protein AAX27_02206 [Aliarcobacter thereius]OCL85752.1 hypothetical protein AAX26_01819 [Aliarcobacter thereius]
MILSLLKDKAIGIIALLVLAIVLLYLYNSLETTKTKLETKEKEYQFLEEKALLAIDELNKALLLQIDISKEQNINKTKKIEVVKQSEETKYQAIQRGEIKQDENSDFIVVDF